MIISAETESDDKCKVVSMLDKPENKAIADLHYIHKENKLRSRIRDKKFRQDAFDKEQEVLQHEKEENQVFRLAAESFPISKCSTVNEFDAGSSRNSTSGTGDSIFLADDVKLSGNSSQESAKLVEKAEKNEQIDDKNGLPCGHRIGKRVILRGFHDRIHTEPRGTVNLHRKDPMNNNDERQTYKSWLHSLTNDPKIVVSFDTEF